FGSPEKKQRLLKTKDFEFSKPRPVSPLSLEKVDQLKIKRKVSDSDNEKIDGEKVLHNYWKILIVVSPKLYRLMNN
ncbi:hypothetical protein DOY81_012886, partial [Sarcophaga bullata]